MLHGAGKGACGWPRLLDSPVGMKHECGVRGAAADFVFILPVIAQPWLGSWSTASAC